MFTRDSIDQAIHHPIRGRLIRSLWHSSEALSVERFRYLEGGWVPLTTLSYHVQVLEREGIVALAHEESTGGGSAKRFYVLGGPNSGEAIRRLNLTGRWPCRRNGEGGTQA